MADRVVLHVGAMKTGTTYLQSTLYTNRGHLAELGVLVPGETWGRQVDAVLDVLERDSHPTGRSVRGAWARMVAEIREWPGTAVISVELLAPRTPRQVERIASSFAGTPLDIVLSVRDLNRTVPAMWQESVQNGRSWTFDDYAAAVERGRPRPARREEDIDAPSRSFWRQQAVVRLARLWRAAGPLHLVTVPPPGSPSSLLLERFAEAIGIGGAELVTASRDNGSLGAPSTEVLRRLNAVLDQRGLAFPVGTRVRKRLLAKTVMPALAAEEPRMGLPVMPWAVEHAAGMARGLQRLDLELHGDWADLEPAPVPGVRSAEVAVDQVAAAARAAYVAFRNELLARPRYYGVIDPDEPPEPRSLPEPAEDVIDEAVGAMADLVDWARRRVVSPVGV